MLTILLGLLTPITIFLLVCIINLIIRLFKPNTTKIVVDDDTWSIIGFLTFITLIISTIVAILLPYEYHTEKTIYELESLEDGQYKNGTFYLGCGKVNDKLKYTFYYKDNGYFKLEQLNPNYTKIKYAPKPKYIIYKTVRTNNLYNGFVVGINWTEKSYVLCVPKGTIKNNYYLDAK